MRTDCRYRNGLDKNCEVAKLVVGHSPTDVIHTLRSLLLCYARLGLSQF